MLFRSHRGREAGEVAFVAVIPAEIQVAVGDATVGHGGPGFVGALEGALRGYKEINLRAMQRLAPGGVLATYTCSHHMQDAELRQVLAEVSADARRKLRVLEWAHQPGDHPVLATMPESEYLRGYVVRAD